MIMSALDKSVRMPMSSPHIRAITLGLNLKLDSPDNGVQTAREFFAAANHHLSSRALDSRSFRLCCQPLDELVDGRPWHTDRIAEFAVHVENALGDIWFCLPGPFFRHANDPPSLLDVIPAVLGSTRNVFMNTLVSGATGMHRRAIKRAAATIQELAKADAWNLANFRFAVMSSVGPGTPFFPASWHAGKPGFSIALELAELANTVFAQPGGVNERLGQFRCLVNRFVQPMFDCALAIAEETQTSFRGFDFSLAPYPGERASAVLAVEKLSGSPVGSMQFLFSLYALNHLLKNGFSRFPQVGFNGTMLSVLEDSYLAEAVGKRTVDIKDLLLYCTVCGCGLDMVPLPQDARIEQISGLIEAVSTEAIKWNKPLITRVLPGAAIHENTSFDHVFLVNTRPVELDDRSFSMSTDSDTFFDPSMWVDNSPAVGVSPALSDQPSFYQSSQGHEQKSLVHRF